MLRTSTKAGNHHTSLQDLFLSKHKPVLKLYTRFFHPVNCPLGCARLGHMDSVSRHVSSLFIQRIFPGLFVAGCVGCPYGRICVAFEFLIPNDAAACVWPAFRRSFPFSALPARHSGEFRTSCPPVQPVSCADSNNIVVFCEGLDAKESQSHSFAERSTAASCSSLTAALST